MRLSMAATRSPEPQQSTPTTREERTSEIVPVSTEKASPLYLSVAGATDIGLVREKNEDAFIVADLTGGTLLDGQKHQRFDVGERGVLLAVSDGMGGAHAGEVASALVVETLTRAMRKAPSDQPRDALMDDAIQRAHRAVWDESKREGKKMGATLTAVFVHNGDAYIAEVGDSRAYLIRKGQIKQLTHDQSMVQMLLDSGVIKPEDAEHSPIRNVILQAMGNQPDVKIALAKLALRDRDCIVLCSDGLTSLANDEEIRDVVLESGRPEVATQALVDLANQRGGKDNTTVIVVGVGGSLPGPADSFGDTFEVLKEYDAPVRKK